MKNFTAPEMEIEKFDVTDVITASVSGDDNVHENDSPIV